MTNNDKIRILANSGDVMNIDGGAVAINLDGIIETRNGGRVPILLEHDRTRVIGFAEVSKVDASGVYMAGEITADHGDAWNFEASFEKGQPWGASLGFCIVDDTMASDGVQVNGRMVPAGTRIANAVEIYEVSIVSIPADASAHVVEIVPPSAEGSDEQTQRADPLMCCSATITEYQASFNPPAVIKPKEGSNMTEETVNNTRVATLAAMMQAGARIDERGYKASELEAANQIKDLDFRSIVEASAGWTPTHAERSNAGEWLKAASSYGLSNIVTSVASEILHKYFDDTAEPWRKIFKISSCADMRPAYRYRIDGSYEMRKISAGGEFPHIVYSDEKRVISADLYASQAAIPEAEILAGNTLGAIDDIMKRAAGASKTCIKSVLYKTFTGASETFGGGSYYVSGGNSFTNKALTFENLTAAVADFYAWNKCGAAPRYLVVPGSKWALANTLINSTAFYTTDGDTPAADSNPLHTLGIEVVAVPELDLSEFGGDGGSWYLLADSNTIPAFEAVFLNGQTTPRMRRQDVTIGFDGIRFDTSVIFGAAEMDNRGAVKFAE